MKLSKEQQRVVSENMGLVGKVIRDRVHGVNHMGIYTYDDIFQIGCIGLCKAAYTDKGGCFSTYAYRLIWNEICSALIHASRRSATEVPTDPEILVSESSESELFMNISDLHQILDRAEASASGVAAKGIRALRLMNDGFTCHEIGEQMGASPNNVTAWVSKARKTLQCNNELRELKNTV